MDDLDEVEFAHFLDRNNFLFSNILEDVESHHDAGYVAGCEIFEGLQCVTFGEDSPKEDLLNELWLNAPASLFFAQRVMWTSEPDPAPTEDSWLVTVVIPDKPAVFFAKKVTDELWEPFPAPNAPWFAVSTAGSMRKAQQGTPVPPLIATERSEVFQTPAQMPIPPVNGDGVVG